MIEYDRRNEVNVKIKVSNKGLSLYSLNVFIEIYITVRVGNAGFDVSEDMC